MICRKRPIDPLRTWSGRLVRRIFAYLPKDWNHKDQIEGGEDFAAMLATPAGRQFVDPLLLREGRFS